MAYENILFDWSFPANADLSASQNRFVALNSSGKVAQVSTAGADAIGVLQDKPSAIDRTAQVRVLGIAKVVAGAAIAAAANVKSDNVGRATTASMTAGDIVLGRALAAASAAGEIIPVLLVGPYKY